MVWATLPSLQQLVPNEIVAKGFCSDVYAWGEGRVLKLFQDSISGERVERYFNTARTIHSTGLPVPAVHELVEHKARHGIIFERVDGVSMLEWCQARPWMIFSAARQLAELHFQIHQCVAPPELQSQKQRIRDRMDAARDVSAAARETARICLEKLPDGDAVCHGDFHPANIIFTKRGPFVIDWDSATRGHPFGDVACTSRLFQVASLPPWTPRYMHLLLKISRQTLHRNYLKRYLHLRSGTLEEITAWLKPLSVMAVPAWRKPL